MERSRARRELKDAVRRSTSVVLMPSAAGVFGRTTSEKNVNEVIVKARNIELTAFPEKIEVTLVRLFSLALTGLLQLGSFFSCDGTGNVHSAPVQDKVGCYRSGWIGSEERWQFEGILLGLYTLCQQPR